MEFKLKSNETKNHFIWRVYKLGYKTGQLTKEEAGDICSRELGLQFDESAYRKNFEYFDNMWKDVKEEYLIDSDEDLLERLSKLEEKEDELYKATVKLRDKGREYRTKLRNNARFDNLLDVARETAERMSEAYPFTNNKPYVINSDEKVAVLLLSDWHYGIEIDNFLNKHNIEICIEKVNQVFEETIEFCKKNNIKDLKVINLGDLINGFLHLGTRVENEENVITQLMEVTELLAKLLMDLSEHFDTIEYSDTLDNHSRVTAQKQLSIEAENFGRLISWYLAPRLRNVMNVKINEERFDETISKVDLLGETCFAVHGHNDSFATVVSKLTLMTRQIPNTIFMGHTHSHQEKDNMGIDVVVNGTLSGTDSYAKEKRLTSKPMQKVMIFKKNINGKINITDTRRINFN